MHATDDLGESLLWVCQGARTTLSNGRGTETCCQEIPRRTGSHSSPGTHGQPLQSTEYFVDIFYAGISITLRMRCAALRVFSLNIFNVHKHFWVIPGLSRSSAISRRTLLSNDVLHCPTQSYPVSECKTWHWTLSVMRALSSTTRSFRLINQHLSHLCQLFSVCERLVRLASHYNECISLSSYIFPLTMNVTLNFYFTQVFHFTFHFPVETADSTTAEVKCMKVPWRWKQCWWSSTQENSNFSLNWEGNSSEAKTQSEMSYT